MDVTNTPDNGKEGRTPGGSALYRHGAPPQDEGWRPPAPCLYGPQIEAHMDAAFPGRETMVFHEIVSDLVHIDVFVMKPTQEEPFYVLYTTGMSDLPMALPAELLPQYASLQRAELMLFLPAGWRLGGMYDLNSGIPEEYYWPVRLLKFLARFPHEYGTWLGHGHSIPNDGQYTPYAASTAFSGAVLAALREEISEVKAEDGATINLYMVVPVYREEMDFKLEHGTDALLDKILELPGNPFILDPRRRNTCAK